jgi:excisionase family DNA binding protein
MAEQRRWRQDRARAATPSLDEDRLTYTLTEAAQQLGISRWLAYEAAHRGELPVCRIGRRMLVPRAALLRLLDEQP